MDSPIVDNLVSEINQAYHLLQILQHCITHEDDARLLTKAIKESPRFDYLHYSDHNLGVLYYIFKNHYLESAKIVQIIAKYIIKDLTELFNDIETKLKLNDEV